MDLSGKKINVLGAGRSGRAAAALCLHSGASEVHLFDTRGTIQNASYNAKLHPNAREDSATECDLLVISPGLDTYGSLVKAFAAKAGESIGEIELAYRHHRENRNGRVIAITGTNGKTTTTGLLAELLNAASITAAACGNYGIPASEVVMQDKPPRVLVLEASSFQLETIVDFHPDIAIWLNFAPDHLDRYPDLESYHRAKMRVFENQQAADTAIVRFGEDVGTLTAKRIEFSTESESAAWWSDGTTLFHNSRPQFNLSTGSHLRGLHNAENAMAAIAAAKVLGVENDIIAAALKEYRPPRHRCELVRTLNEVEWLNDSKATNAHALSSALRSLPRPLVLIAGGKEKNLDYSPVLPLLKEHCIAAITFGEIGDKLHAQFAPLLPTTACETLDEAVASAQKIATPGSTVLFSPGTSSYDQFENYEQRGDTFCQLVKQLES